MQQPGRVAVVTGAARGLGRVIAATLARERYTLVLADVSDCAATAAEVAALGAEVWPSRIDVSSEADVLALASGVRERFGRADALVNNAGVSLLVPAEQTTAEAWRRVLDINLTGAFLLCREFGAQMLAAGSGSVVNVASIAGLRGVSHRAAYNASKHGLVGLSSTLAAEWGGRGVRVNAVCPGAVDTPMLAPAFTLPGFRDQLEERTPMKRVSTPDEIARPIRFLLSDEASFITGTYLTIDGGLTSITAI